MNLELSKNTKNTELNKKLKDVFQRKENIEEKPKEDKIVILHTNDIHSSVNNTPCGSIGYAKISTLINKYRAKNPVIVLDAGDAFHGGVFANISKGESIVKVMNALKYDAMTPGNHDFSYGKSRLVEIEKEANFPLLSANILKKDGTSFIKQYTIKKINGVKVGIFGVTTPDTALTTLGSNIKGLKFADPIETANKMVKKLKKRNVDLILMVSHLGLMGEYSSKKVAASVKGIDVIVDGHSHDELDKGLIINDTLITQAGFKSKNLGKVKLVLKNKKVVYRKAKLIKKEDTENVCEDVKIKELINKIEGDIKKKLNIVVGKTEVLLDGERDNVCTKQTNLGTFIAKSMRKASNSDCAFFNGGCIWSSIEPGEITFQEIMQTLPYENHIVVKEMSGEDIVKALEHGVSKSPIYNTAFPQVEGIKFEFDNSRKVGDRIIKATINGKYVEKDKKYLVAVNDMIATGGDGYSMVKDLPVISTNGLMTDALIKLLREE